MIQLNPAYQNGDSQSRVSESNDDDEVHDSTDSESSEYIIVDDVEPTGKTGKTAAERLHERQKKSTTTKKNWIRRWQSENDQTRTSPTKRKTYP